MGSLNSKETKEGIDIIKNAAVELGDATNGIWGISGNNAYGGAKWIWNDINAGTWTPAVDPNINPLEAVILDVNAPVPV